MLFDSFSFLIFFPIVTILYFLLPHRWRWLFLLVASGIFYIAFIPKYIFVLGALIVIDYTVALWIERSTGARRTHLLLFSIFSMVGMLFVFKYFNFFVINIDALAAFLHWHYSLGILTLALPLGLSFHTFQSLSYVIEVYRGKQKAERHFGIYALYVMFYPQLVAGPIERPQQLLPQFYVKHAFEYKRVSEGLKLMAWGLFKKIVVADRLGVLVDTVFRTPHAYGGLSLCVASVFFAFQIYNDFSGYTDIALGSAQVMGFVLVQNFDRPFSSRSIAEFWRRWHISLSSWFRDYFFTPLAIFLSRKTSSRWSLYAALLITFSVIGLWHGARWTYCIFGALQGLYIVFGMITKQAREKILSVLGIAKISHFRSVMQVLVTFVLVTVSLVFFRASNVRDALYILTHLFSGFSQLLDIGYIRSSLFGLGLSMNAFFVSIALIAFVEGSQYWGVGVGMIQKINSWPWYGRWTLYYALVTMLVAFGSSGNSPFIYFQF